ncbi:MAG: PAS domain S-box protein [Verrucomicrobiota bacterium]
MNCEPNQPHPEKDARVGRHLTAIVESSDDAIVSKDLNGTILSWNKGAQQIFGYGPEEVIGKSITILIPPERIHEETEILSRIRAGERIDHYETIRQRKDRSLVNISLTVSPIRDDSGKIVGASKIARDITEQKRASSLRQHFTALVESSDDAILSKDLNGIIQTWNKGAETIFGYTADEVIGKPVTILMPEGLQNEEPRILERIRNGERIHHYETVRRHKNGTLINISLTVSPIKDSSGKVVGASKIARDITATKRVEADLLQAQQELKKINAELEERIQARTLSLNEAVAQMKEFSYTVSHDLRGPVRAMHGYAMAVIEDFGDRLDARGREYLERIVRGSDRMDKLIHDVLIYSRLAQSEIHSQPIALEPLIREIIQESPEMRAPRSEIILRKPLLPMMAHEPALRQVLSNLLVNAHKFVAPGTTPRVEVRTERRADKVRLWISDNGIGIKPQFHSRLFRMFERVNQDNHYQGTGVGLAIVKKAMDKMGGAVGVDSDGVLGSSFWIELPSAE